MGCELNVKTGRACEVSGRGTAIGIVNDAMTIAAALVARLITVLEMVIAEPGTRV